MVGDYVRESWEEFGGDDVRQSKGEFGGDDVGRVGRSLEERL